MKKLIGVIIFIYSILFILPIHSYSQSFSFLDGCGNAEASDEAKFCCQTSKMIPDIIGYSDVATPFLGSLGSWINSIVEKTSEIKEQANLTPCLIGYPSDPKDPNCICLNESEIGVQPIESMRKMCERYINSAELNDCIDCAVNKSGVWTSIGCIYGNISKFITEKVLGWGIGLAGMISLLCIIFAAFQMQTSRGNPEKIKKAQELLTSCIIGLLLIIFSTFILRVIGVSILKIPGFI